MCGGVAPPATTKPTGLGDGWVETVADEDKGAGLGGESLLPVLGGRELAAELERPPPPPVDSALIEDTPPGTLLPFGSVTEEAAG